MTTADEAAVAAAQSVELSLDGAKGSFAVPQGSFAVPQPARNEVNADMNPYKAHQSADDEEASTGNVDEEDMDHLHDDRMEPPVADAHGEPSKMPVHEETEQEKKDAKKKRSVIVAGIESFKYLYSLALVLFSVTMVMAALFSRQTGAANYGIHPAGAFFIFWFLIVWLAMIEGGQGCLIGLQPIDKEKYAESHPVSLKCTTLAHKGDNMERFIVGRQFLVVLIVFVVNIMGAAIPGAQVLGLPPLVQSIFLGSGLAMILTAINLGQLTAQVNAAVCMLDFINNYFMLFSTYVSLGIEFSGLLHSVYLVQIIFSKITGQPIDTKEPPRNAVQNLFFWVRVLMSLTILGFAFAVTLKALFMGKTTMWKGVPEAVSVIIFFILMCFVGMMEGMQIALFAVLNMPEEDIVNATVAKANCDLTFAGDNLQAFLIGRQICVTCCMFVVARITTLNFSEGETLWGASAGLQAFYNTGLLGAIITTIVASLAWRIVASSFSLAFLSNPLIYLIIRLCLILEKSGVCSASWVFARYHKPIAGYQPEEVYFEGAPRHGSEPVTRRDKDIDRLSLIVKYTYSLALLAFSVLLVMAALFSRQTGAGTTYGIHPAGAFFIFWFLVLWLAMIEGGQGCLVGLQPVDKDKYLESHPLTHKCTTLAHKGDNMERFIVGRQFLVVLIVFVVNIMGAAIPGAQVLGLPEGVLSIFLGTGLSMILTAINLGQLTAQVNAAVCMLDFINNYFMLFSTYVSLGIEFSGLLHSVYLVQIIFSKITGQPIDTKEPPRNAVQNLFFWVRVLMSLTILGFAFAVTLKALFMGKTTMWKGVPEAVSVIIFFILMCFVGMMEGMQIALFAVLNMPEEDIVNATVAKANCDLTFAGDNLQAFLIGRQICVTCCMFVVARITTLNFSEGETLWGASAGLQAFYNTGLLGAIITTIVASLAWRIVASSFPLAFLSNPLIYLIIRLCLLLEASGVCSASWVLARYQKPIAGYQPDAVYLEGAQKHTSAPANKREKDIDVTTTVIKYVYSTALLFFSIVLVMACIFTKQTKLSSQAHPAVAFVLFWYLLIWLAMIEGGQGCLVGLQPIAKSLYVESHPVTHKCTSLSHKGDNMERFIVGRQFLVVLIVFITNMSGAANPGADVLGLPSGIQSIFLSSGLAMILTTIILGQLTAQVNAANCMLDFINNYFMLFSTYVSLGIEFSGLLHSVYLVQVVFSLITGQPVQSKEPPRNAVQNLFFWVRVLMSLAILSFAFAITLKALFIGKTTMWKGVPSAVSVIVFFVLMCFVGLMEGMQIALFAVVNMPKEKLESAKVAKANCELTFSGQNFQAFLIGRQICVTCCMFVVARITTLNFSDGETLWGAPAGVQNFYNTGLLGAIITTIVASLAWRIVASSFPLAFMSNPLIYIIIRLCLLLEATGICSAAWLFALFHKQIAGFQVDEVYVGTTEEQEQKRAAAGDDAHIEA